MNVFITGVSRGIGLGLTKQAIEHGHRVLGIARHPEDSRELSELRHQYPEKLEVIKMDLMDDDAPLEISTALKHYEKMDLVINNAGIYEKGTSKEAFLKSFHVNSYIPFMIGEILLPKLKSSSSPKLVHLSSMMGSMTENTSGGSYAYRSSKAALNMINKCLAIENEWLTSVVVHPGWVQTRMGGEDAPLSVDESTLKLWTVINELKQTESGSFKDFEGRSIPW